MLESFIIRRKDNWVQTSERTWALSLEFDSFGLDYYAIFVIEKTDGIYHYRGFITNGVSLMYSKNSLVSLGGTSYKGIMHSMRMDLKHIRRSMGGKKFNVCPLEKATQHSMLKDMPLRA